MKIYVLLSDDQFIEASNNESSILNTKQYLERTKSREDIEVNNVLIQRLSELKIKTVELN